MSGDEPSYVTCPCGFRAQGTPKEALGAYRAHECTIHRPEATGTAWPAVVALVAVLVFLAVMCGMGKGLWP